MNEYDSGRMADLLLETNGITRTENPEDADIILLNTCSVREKPQEKVFSELGRFKELKQEKPHLIIGVAGCVASQEGNAIIERAPYVDLVFGPQTLHRLPQMIKAKQSSGHAQVDTNFLEIEKFDHLPPPKVEGSTAFVSIMEGCSKYCSYCIVPYTRGEEVSRRFNDVLDEVIHLSEQGVKEITLLGQNVNAYRGEMDDGDITDFSFLLEVIAEIENIERIRFVTSHPREFTQRLIDVYAKIPKLANQVYLPAQHGSDRMLAAMKRGYTALEYKSIIRRLRAVRPNISISSDFIVGFPGETDKDFELLMNFVKDIGHDSSFSFLYSPRPGTPAAELKDDTPMQIKRERLMRLQEQLEANNRAYVQTLVGTTQKVLVEGVAKKNADDMQGRADSNRVVNFYAGPEGKKIIGEFVNVKITQSFAHSLRGELI